jgi:hypothetical protein
MRIVRDDIGEDEMVLAFLSAEVDSPRFSGGARFALGDLELVRDPDLSDTDANQRRRSALDMYRGWGRNAYLFTNFPREVIWKLVEVEINELGEFRYARVPEWIALSGGSLLVKDGASNAAKEPLDETREGILAVARDIRRGVTFPPIIAATEGEDQIHVLLEGHTRASAYIRALERRDTCEVIVGYVSDLSGWCWY